MTHSKVYVIHQILFLFLVTLVCFLPLNDFKSFSNLHVYLTLILFFGLGIPHGALDLSLGKKLLQPKFGSRWRIVFVLVYLLCVGFIVVCWVQSPLPSFLFFIALSAFHFGFSDRLNRNGWIGALEGFGRGFLTITLPAYFYPHLFQELVESSLSDAQALMLIKIVQLFFYPDLILVIVVILYGFLQRDKSNLMNSLELISLLVLFLSLKPFAAFLIYFCFLHSFRHILYVLEEMNRLFNWDSVKWLIVQALPATVVTLLCLAISYLTLEHEVIDVPTMLNLFFISLAALTFPHMILVGAVKN
jgi:Brp/Blh family beta-carotene 15,15'-monooxygenase